MRTRGGRTLGATTATTTRVSNDEGKVVQNFSEYRVVWKTAGGAEQVRHWACRADAQTFLTGLSGPLEYAYEQTRPIKISDWGTPEGIDPE